jgi:hypothetical protein
MMKRTIGLWGFIAPSAYFNRMIRIVDSASPVENFTK